MIWMTRKDELYDEVDDLKAEIKDLKYIMYLMEAEKLSIKEATELARMHSIMKV